MFDREAILAAVDLLALADELLGVGRGPKRSPMWRCPSPEHRQTGRTPPVGVFTGRSGEMQWHCHGCGIGGTAVDLVMRVRHVGPREALAELAVRAGIPEQPGSLRSAPIQRRADSRGRAVLSPAYPAPQPVPALERYVSECSDALWTSAGAAVLRWMTECRGIPEDVLRVNRIGADLGVRREARPVGIPEVRRAAVVLPVLARGAACYVQLRMLNAGRDCPKYLGTRVSLAPNPRLGIYRPAPEFDRPVERPEVIVTEGIIDALSAAAAGYCAVAVLGTAHARAVTAIPLARLARPLVIAFDPDPPGQAATERMVQFLTARHRPPHVLRLRDGDLNENLLRSGDWSVEMAARVEHATAPRLPPELVHEVG